jgi:hypothetical protein
MSNHYRAANLRFPGDDARRPEPLGRVLVENTPVAFDDASAAPVPAGPIRLFIGVRSDPFFADADGSFHGFHWTGRDAFADKNVAEAAEQAALIVLPDILRYDRSKPVGYPNGRAITNDCLSLRFAWMSNGKIPPQGLKPHDDLLAEFPYLGPPNLYPV